MISVNFTSDVENVVATEHLFQWDNGQKLSISGIGTSADIHFANKKIEKALVVTPTVSSSALVAPIPNSLLAEPYSIIAYVYVPSDDGARTLKTVIIYVEPRTQPSDFVLEEDEGITTLETISQRANAIISGIQSDYNNFKSTIQSELDEMKANTTVPNADTLDGLHANEIAVNPNIAINPNFAINTGGITSVSGGTNSTFLADKWYVSRVVATNTGKAITLAWDGKNNSNGYLQQQILNTSDLFGKKVTLSFNLDGVRKSATVTVPTTKNQRADVTVMTGIIAGVTNYMGTHIAIIIFTTTTTSHTISDVKLEIGSIWGNINGVCIAHSLDGTSQNSDNRRYNKCQNS